MTIPVKSIKTSDQKRDKHLLDEDFFYEEKHPTIEYVGESFHFDSHGQLIKIAGKLTMRGVTKKVSFDVTNWYPSDEEIRFTAKTQLYRRDYGIDYGVNAVVGNRVKITIRAVARK